MFSLKKIVSFLLLFVCMPAFLQAQNTTNLTVSLPLNRAVYQRNQSGTSLITVKGTYEKQVDRIEARLTVLNGVGNAGEWSDWKTLQELPLNRNFKGVMSVNQGWYKLELRGVLNGTVLGDVASVSKVGVGEVFIIAGQSNAEGVGNPGGGYGSQGASSDLVNCLDLENDQTFGGDGYVNYTPFSQLSINARIAPRGTNSWLWGKLGDYLVQKLNVPVLFFNVGFSGTSVQAWSMTAEGFSAPNPWVGGIYENKQPYKNLYDVLSYFTPQLGVRAVLWFQGETDTQYGTLSEAYKQRLQTVINRTRLDTGKDIAWVIAQASAYALCTPNCAAGTAATSSTEVLKGQLMTVQQTSNVFLGPATDNIQNTDRADGAHFHDDGLVTVAQAWNDSLNDTFFSSSKPQIPTVLPDITYTCKSNAVEVSLPSGYRKYVWANNADFNNTTFSSSQTQTFNQDNTFYVRLTDQNGNVSQLPAINIKVSNPVASLITATRPTTFCDGDSTILSLPNAVIYNWNTGTKESSILVKNTGSFSGYFVDSYGCLSGNAPTVNVVKNTLPSKPIIVSSTGTVFCADTNTVLKVTNTDATAYLWNTGSQVNDLKVSNSGTFTVKTISKENCYSPESDKVSITVNALPPTPTLTAIGATSFCLDTNVTLVSTNVNAVSYRWNSLTDVSQKVTLRRSGTFTVRTLDANNCVSKSSNSVSLTANPLPDVPKVAALKDTVFCDGSNTILQLVTSAGTNTPVWQMQQNKVITLSQTNEITVASNGIFRGYQIDANQCKSALSSPIYVTNKANPVALTTADLVRLSPYSVGITNPSAQEYSWQINQKDVGAVASTIRFAEAATISVYAKVYYPLVNNRILTCRTAAVENYFPLYDDNGISIYPNPGNGLVSVDSRTVLQNANILLYSIKGELLYSKSGNTLDTVNTFDFTTMPEGTYLMKVATDDYSIVKRIIINR